MKLKKLFIASMLGLTASLLFGAASCSEAHEHSFAEWETVAQPTCMAFGLEKRACECGYVEYNTKEALAHTPVIDASVEATCDAFGKTEGSHCSVCGIVIKAQTETPKIAHSFSDWEVVAPTSCTAFGLEKRTCECGFVEYNVENAFSHTTVIDAGVEATCETFGKTEGSHCEVCGQIFVAQSILAPIGHNCDEITFLQDALCNQDGVKRVSCSNADCDYYYDESFALAELDSAEIYADAVQYTGVLQSFGRFGNLIDESSAFLISADGKVVTRNYSIDNAFSALFVLGDTYYEVTEVLAYSEDLYTAVLQTNAIGLPYANICEQEPTDAEKVYIVGAPSGYASSISSGVISNVNRDFDGVRFIQHDANMDGGYVGGPLLNRFGEVIGINIGYIGEDLLNVSVWAPTLNELDYSNPITMAEYGEITYTPVEELANWVLNNHNTTGTDACAYELFIQDGFSYYLGYNDGGYCFVQGQFKLDEKYELVVDVFFHNAEGTYEFYAALTDGTIMNETRGYIDAATYDETTVLTYDTFYGRYWAEAELMGLYTASIYETLGWFSACLDMYFDYITLESFGFEILSYDRDEDALNKLNEFVVANGVLNEETYVLSGGANVGNDTMQFAILYTPATENTQSNTVMKVDYYTANGALYSVALTLNATENGNRFDFMYAVYNGTEYVTQNTAWGYLDAHTFTIATQLTCYEFIGMGEYEDGLLMEYTSLLSYVMGLLNDNALPSISPELSIKDLGFWFYFG